MSTFFARGTSLVASHTTWNGLITNRIVIDRGKAYDYKRGSCPSKLGG